MLRVTEREEARLDRPSMTGGKAAIKARGYPPIFCENRFPPRPLRGAALRSTALTAAPPPLPETPFSMVRTQALEVIMGMVQSIGTASDHILETLAAGLELEFGHGAGEALGIGSWRLRRRIFAGMPGSMSAGLALTRASMMRNLKSIG